MKIYVSHSRSFDFENELYKPIRASVLNTEHEFFLPHENGQSINTKEVLQDCDLILAEVSFPSTGQGIELGWANMLNKRIVCISRKASEVSGSLKYITDNFITYSDKDDLVSKIILALNSKN